MSTGKAKELAREAVERFDTAESGAPSVELERLLAEHAVNLALEAACEADCTHCLQGVPAYFSKISGTWRHRDEGGDYSCHAAAIRAMMEPPK